MQRRNFIKTSAAGSAFLAANNMFLFQQCKEPEILSQNQMDPIITILFLTNHEDEMLTQMIGMKTRFGFRRFGLLFPHKSIRYTRFPEPEAYSKFGELLLRVKNKLTPYDIETDWWCHVTLKSGKDGPWQNITGIDGSVSAISSCPLDNDFRETFSDNFTTVVKIARPSMIIVEDDFELSNHGAVRFGCFCPLHLAEFAKRQGHYYSREELMEIFSMTTPESISLRRAWAELSRDSLVGLASLIRKKVDRIAPETRIMLCQPGPADFDGDFTEAVTKAFAGKTRPAVRLYGCDYASDSATRLPGTIFHALYSSQHLPADFELFHESDTFPHIRFFMSANKLKSLMTAAFAYGIDDSLLWPLQMLDNPMEDEGYASMFHSEIKRFEALKTAVKECRVEGCEILYYPFERSFPGGNTRCYAWAEVTGRLGIPHTSAGGKVKLVSGNTIEVMSDESIQDLLRGSVFLDGGAAHSLYIRGFGELIGSEVFPGETPNFCFEGIRNSADFKNIKGTLMKNSLFIGRVGSEGGSFFNLKPLKGAEILTDFLSFEEKPVIPGMIRFENKLGGRVAITAFDFKSNNSSSAILNYRKKEIIRQTIEWLGEEPLPVFVKDSPNIFCIFNRSDSNSEAVIVIINLSSDPLDSVSIDVAPEWINSELLFLNKDGKWTNVKVEIQDRTIKLYSILSLMDPLIFKLIK